MEKALFEKGDLVECVNVQFFEFEYPKALGVVQQLRTDSFGETIYDIAMSFRVGRMKLILPLYISSLRIPTAEQFFYQESGVEILMALLKEES